MARASRRRIRRGSSSASTRPTGLGRQVAARASDWPSHVMSWKATEARFALIPTRAGERCSRSRSRSRTHPRRPFPRWPREPPVADSPAAGGAPLHVATLNLRNIADRWPERIPLLIADMAALQPDLIGLQECVFAVG